MNINPLQQYFRRPAVYIKLPSGGVGYPEGSINIPESGEFPVYPMTALDEITARTPDALFNGSAVADLIKSCVPDIKEPWTIQSSDLDAILIGIKVASGGDNVDLSTECPSCKEPAEYGISLSGVLQQLKAPNFTKELQVNDLSIKFKPLTYKEINDAGLAQFEIQKEFASLDSIADDTTRNVKSQELVKKVTDTTMHIIANAIEYIKTPTIEVDDKNFIYEFLSKCDSSTYAAIRDYNAQLRETSEIKPFKITCNHCQFEYEQPFTLNTSDFFG